MIWILPLLPLATAYIRLTYPPTRYPFFNYSIESGKSHKLCSVPKNPKGAVTWLRSGEDVNITWFQSVSDNGSLKLELLNEMDQIIAVLSPITSVNNNDRTLKTSATIMLPKNYECYNCVIRIILQDAETGKNYSSHYSCADVNIVNEIPDGDTCLGNGKRKHGICECDLHSSGDNCQYHDECTNDSDCNSHGRCVPLSNGALTMKQCFCQRGYFGTMCQHVSQSFTDDSEFLPSLYHMHEVGQDNDKIYWRILQDEIEFVLKFKTKSWIGIGWKPKSSDEYCPSSQNFTSSGEKFWQDLMTTSSSWWTSQTSTNKQNKTVANEVLPSESISNNRSSDTHGVKIEKICNENEEFSHCPEFTRQCEASCDWTKFPETIPNCPRTCGTPKCICKEGFVRSANDNNTCVPFHFCSDEAEIECPINSTWAKCGIACEPTCENMYDTTPCPASCEEPACTCADNYVRYGGNCIFWGDCPNLEERFASDSPTSVPMKTTTEGSVQVEFTPGNSSNQSETTTLTAIAIPAETKTVSGSLACGINETINECGRACETNCNNVYSREKCTQCYRPACACIYGYARIDDRCIYWADCPHGNRRLPHDRQHTSSSILQPPKTSATSAASGTESVNSSLKLSNEISELNLADAEAFINVANVESQNNISNAGFASLLESEVDGDVCYGDWRWPPGCRDCDYRISWNYLDDTDEIEFSIETRAPSNWWTGVGFSPTGTMVEADIIIVKSRNGELSLHDMYSTEYGVPREDSKQDVYTPTVIGTHVNGVLRVQFTRKRDTGDRKADHHFSETNCYKFLFPVSGGRLEPNGQLSKHISIPHVSENKICIQSCVAPQNLQTTSSCETEYRYPAGCSDAACDYIAKWEYSMARKDVKFEISSKELGRWTGIGFSRDGQMASSDIYTGWVFEGKAYVTDRFAYGRQLPAIDPADRQDIYEISGKAEDDIQTITFRRKVLPADTITDFPLNVCYYFLFPVGGGRVLARKSQDFQNAKTPIGYHDLYQPKVSRTKICICDQNGVSIASDDGPPAVRNRRRINQKDVSFRLKRQSQDPFEVQIDHFAGIDKVNASIPSEMMEVKSESAPERSAHLPINTTTLVDIPKPESELWTASAADEPERKPIQQRLKEEEKKNAEHSMDCLDMVIGVMVDGMSQVRDYYSFSHILPQPDELFGGKDSLTSATAYQQDNITTVIFRKPLKASDHADRTISPKETVVIWTKGVISGESQVVLEKTTTSFLDGESSRGQLIINFFDNEQEESKQLQKLGRKNECFGSYEYPANCTNEKCNYTISWWINGKKISFSLAAAIPTYHWTGIGFSFDGSMAHSDVIVVNVLDEGIVKVLDMFSPSYSRPKIDNEQNLFDIRTSYDQGRVYANFSRYLVSNDENDISIDQCVYFLYPVNGGILDMETNEIHKHKETPISSGTKICAALCVNNLAVKKMPQNEPLHKASILPEESITTESVIFDVVIRILNREWNPYFANQNTQEFQQLATEVINEVNAMIKMRYPQMRVIEIKKFKKGSILAFMTFFSEDDPPPSDREVKEYLNKQVKLQSPEALHLEIASVILKKTEKESSNKLDKIQNWIVLSIGVSLFLTATFLVCCIVSRSRKVRSDNCNNYNIHYPMNGYGCNNNLTVSPLNSKKSGFENAAYHATHSRQFSQATTASQNGTSKGSPNTLEEIPKGVGETTYQEWFSKVASKPGAQQHEELSSPSVRHPVSQRSFNGPSYMSHTQDVNNFYGEIRLGPPGYYRPY
ncbi:DOMON domain family protein [Acanthocheilonema viteae]